VLVRRSNENNPRPIDEIAFTTAHEIGHLLLGVGHPDEGGGVAPFPSLPLADHQKRLMCSGPNKITGVSRLLVKAEWDIAEQWLIDNPDRRENENNN